MDATVTDEKVETEEKNEAQNERSVSSDLIRGHINTIILRSLYDGDKYGYEIIAEIERKSHGQYSLKQPSLYSALKRLEKDGYVTSYWGGSVGGGRRKYFSLTEAGKLVSEQNQSEWEYSRTVIDSLISDKDFDFSNPAPTSVNMRVLRDTTSRVPRGEGGDDDLDFEPSFDDSEDFKKLEQEIATQRANLAADRLKFEEEMRARNDALLRERAWREQEIAAREKSLEEKKSELETARAQIESAPVQESEQSREQIEALETRVAELTKQLEVSKNELSSRDEMLMRERAWREQELAAREKAIEAKRAELETMRSQMEAASTRETLAQQEEISSLQSRLQRLTELLDSSQTELNDLREREETRQREEENSEQTLKEKEELLETERRLYSERLEEATRQTEETLEEERRKHEEALEEERRRHEEELADAKQQGEIQLAAERRLSEERVTEVRRLAQEQLDAERHRSEGELTAERMRSESQLAEERRRHAEDLRQQEARILAEQEELFRQREKQLLHRNYLDLVNAPPPEEETHEYTYYNTQPAAEETPPPPPETEDYKTVVHRLYSNATSPDAYAAPQERAKSLDGIDFTDLEARAAQDGIKISTAGGKMRSHAEITESIVHKGKALFISGIITFIFCVALGSIILGVQASAGLPAFYPYFIWGVGLAVLLVTGLAYANRYGERSLRRTGPVLLNAIVSYILLVIITLIVALTARADLSNSAQLATFVIVPVIFFLAIILFGATYYVQVRPKKD